MSYGQELMNRLEAFKPTAGWVEPFPIVTNHDGQREESADMLPDSQVFAMLDSIYPNEPFDFDLNPSYCNA